MRSVCDEWQCNEMDALTRLLTPTGGRVIMFESDFWPRLHAFLGRQRALNQHGGLTIMLFENVCRVLSDLATLPAQTLMFDVSRFPMDLEQIGCRTCDIVGGRISWRFDASSLGIVVKGLTFV